MMICNYLSFLIEEIWVDWQNNILFGIILFSVFGEFQSDLRDVGLPNYSIPAFGTQRGGPSFCDGTKGLGYRMGRTPSLGLVSGLVSPFF